MYHEILGPILNMTIDTYNNIIRDIKHHYANEDATANSLKELKHRQKPEEIFHKILELYNHIRQAISYMIRWLPNC